MTGSKLHPYKGLESRAFWRAAVGERHPLDIADLATPKSRLRSGEKIATAGSCFAQHIARHLRGAGLSFMDAEPAPTPLPEADRAAFGYGLFSARYGNVYTSRQLIQLWARAYGSFLPAERVWERDGRFFDPFRPSIEPDGFASPEEVILAQDAHLAAVRRLFKKVDVFIFTLGLTECWASTEDGAVYPTCPGVQAGSFDPSRHAFLNLSYEDVVRDMRRFFAVLRKRRPGVRFILTVSPVPLAATASGQHVLTATTHSKAVLRAAAGQLSMESPDVDYFPSYEIITSPAFRGMFYDVGLREIRKEGVAFVMSQFQRQFLDVEAGPVVTAAQDADDVICDEKALERYG